METPDAADVARARAGDQAAFRALVERHSRAVFQLAWRMTGSEQDAEDIVQETFLKAYRELGRFESRSSFKTWLHRIAANCSYDLLRQRPRHQAEPLEADSDEGGGGERLADPGSTPERATYGSELQDHLRSALNLLTAAERTAFVLRHFEGRSLEEIGTTLGLGLSATKHSIFRAVQKMRRALTPFVEAPGRVFLPPGD